MTTCKLLRLVSVTVTFPRFVDVFELLVLSRRAIESQSRESFLLCEVFRGSEVLRSGKWAVSYSDIPKVGGVFAVHICHLLMKLDVDCAVPYKYCILSDVYSDMFQETTVYPTCTSQHS